MYGKYASLKSAFSGIIRILILTLVCHSLWASTTDIHVCQTHKARYQYRIALANLLLDKTAERYGAAKIVPYDASGSDPTQSRCELLLEMDEVELLYLPPTESRMQRFTIIPTDIHNGMLGFRVLVIRRQDQEKFRQVKSINDLRTFIGGFGKQ